MSEEKLLAFVAAKAGACYDYPFKEDFETAVLRHKDTKRWFGILLDAPNGYCGREGAGYTRVLNIKVPPELGELLRENYAGILLAYHMNKTHWISVLLDGDVSDEEIEKLLALSFELTDKRNRQ